MVDSCEPEPSPYDSQLFLDRWCIPVYSTLPADIQSQYNDVVGTFGLDDIEMYARDVRESWKVYLICLGSTFILIFFWNLMLR